MNRCVSWLMWSGMAVSAMLSPADVAAQSSLQIPLQFDFINPGARSMAMGGAFTGVADDATSAFVNPAGLSQLLRKEVTVEFRARRFEQPFLQAGRLSGRHTGLGEDTRTGALFGTSVDSSRGVSFFSLVVPVSKLTLAAYRHEFINSEESFEARGVFQDDRGGTVRELAYDAARELVIDNYGAAVGYRVNDRIRLGVGASVYSFNMTSTFSRYAHEGFYGAPDKSLEIARFEQNGDGQRMAFNAGALFQIHRRAQAGVNIRRGASFDFRVSQGGFGTPITTSAQVYAFRAPTALMLGLSVRPTNAFMVTAEYGRMGYSRLKRDFVDVQAGGEPDRFRVPNGHELHLGAEYAFAGAKFIPTLRTGMWRDPNHAVAYSPASPATPLDERLGVALSSGKDLVHYTFGGGASLSQSLEVNAAADISSRTKMVTASAVIRF